MIYDRAMVRLRQIVSGGQTGAHRGGLEAAIALGIPHGGWCPKDRRAEDGRIPARFRLRETPSPDYETRTERNVAGSDGTVVFSVGRPAGGTALTARIARRIGKPLLRIDLARSDEIRASERLRGWIEERNIAVLNVAGPRESRTPGLEEAVRSIVQRAFEA